MYFSKAAAAASGAALMLANSAVADDFQTVTIKGSKFFKDNGEQFFIKGAAYQQGVGKGGASEDNGGNPPDPLADADQCERDAKTLKELGANTIRTYALDPSKSHDDCMNTFKKNGIYVITDLSWDSLSIKRNDPAWNTDLYKRYTSVIDDMSKYDNTLAFIAGNEVSNKKNNTAASAYVKAAIRDSKAHISNKGERAIPVGYATADVKDIRDDLANYMNCGNETSAADFWGLNIYEWCGSDATYESSGYEDVVKFYKDFSSALLFTEDGCNQPGGAAKREWNDVQAIYGDKMSDVVNGMIAYEYFQADNDFGLVSADGNDIKTMKDFTALSSQWAKATPSSVSEKAYSTSASLAACPTLSDNWEANGDLLPPTPDEGLCQCMYKSLSCVPSDDVKAEDYGELFGTVCGSDKKACNGIKADAAEGVYGAYSMCNPKEQLGYVMNQYYKNQNEASTACDFKGKAKKVDGAKAASSCSSSLSSASSINDVVATATSAAGSQDGSGDKDTNSSGDGSSTDSSDGADGTSLAMPIAARSVLSVGNLAVSAYVLVAMSAGAAMVLL